MTCLTASDTVNGQVCSRQTHSHTYMGGQARVEHAMMNGLTQR